MPVMMKYSDKQPELPPLPPKEPWMQMIIAAALAIVIMGFIFAWYNSTAPKLEECSMKGGKYIINQARCEDIKGSEIKIK